MYCGILVVRNPVVAHVPTLAQTKYPHLSSTFKRRRFGECVVHIQVEEADARKAAYKPITQPTLNPKPLHAKP